jgi:dTDP-4-amino-4,6-dideoxygalactose transaminase
MYISSRPSHTIRNLFSINVLEINNVVPFNTGRTLFFYTGRYALASGVKALRLRSDDNVLLPSYNCWVEIDPVRQQGVKIKYYRVERDFIIDLKDIEKRIDGKTKAILITHYLGFPQPLEEIIAICRKYGLILIEDCAHAFLSDYEGKPLGSFGDISIFSFRKTLPIPNGAALTMNNGDYKMPVIREEPNSFATLYYLTECLKYKTRNVSILRNLIPAIVSAAVYYSMKCLRYTLRAFHKIFNDKALYLAYPSGNRYRSELEEWSMSALSRRMIQSMNFQEIKETRRRNFAFFLEYFRNDKRVILPIKELVEGVCPLFFPMIIEKRDYMFQELKKEGIVGHDWWGDFHPDVPWNEFPEAQFLKNNILGLPIHQDITITHLEKITEAFKTAFVRISK